jgi:hypothetical protein
MLRGVLESIPAVEDIPQTSIISGHAERGKSYLVPWVPLMGGCEGAEALRIGRTDVLTSSKSGTAGPQLIIREVICLIAGRSVGTRFRPRSSRFGSVRLVNFAKIAQRSLFTRALVQVLGARLTH